MPSIKPNLIILSYYDPGSGFFTVITHIARQLKQHFDIHYVGIGYKGDICQESDWILYPGNSDTKDLAATRCVELAQRLGSGKILIINDLWVIGTYSEPLINLRKIWDIYAYTPIDGHIINTDIVRNTHFLNALVVYTEFARMEIERVYKLVSPVEKTPVHVIPHGIDRAFYRMDTEEKKSARKEIFKGNDWQDAFIVLNANKISERKRIDLTLKAFQLFSENKPDVRLYLHHSHIAPQYYERLTQKLHSLGMHRKVGITPNQSILMTKEKLNQLYNACDLGINTSAGEGWGLVSFEHAATGAAQIVPDHSACAELWTGNAEIIPTKKNYQVKDRPDVVMQEVDVEKAIESLNRLYYNKAYKQEMADKAHALASENKFDWDNIGELWRELLLV